jgi:hypothetical protein
MGNYSLDEMLPEFRSLNRSTIAKLPPHHYRFAWGDYFALSYAWDEAREEVTICVNGQYKSIQKNLAQTLNSIQHLPEFVAMEFKL